jgi:hypothetical protein
MTVEETPDASNSVLTFSGIMNKIIQKSSYLNTTGLMSDNRKILKERLQFT